MGGGVCIKNKYRLKIFTDADTIESSGYYEVIDDCFCFEDETSKYKCNFEKAILIKEDNDYLLNFSFHEPSAYMYLFNEETSIDLAVDVKRLDIDERSLYVEYSTDGESIIKLMISIER